MRTLELCARQPIRSGHWVSITCGSNVLQEHCANPHQRAAHRTQCHAPSHKTNYRGTYPTFPFWFHIRNHRPRKRWEMWHPRRVPYSTAEQRRVSPMTNSSISLCPMQASFTAMAAGRAAATADWGSHPWFSHEGISSGSLRDAVGQPVPVQSCVTQLPKSSSMCRLFEVFGFSLVIAWLRGLIDVQADLESPYLILACWLQWRRQRRRRARPKRRKAPRARAHTTSSWRSK